jgi:methyl-accepting chemotaxis protein
MRSSLKTRLVVSMAVLVTFLTIVVTGVMLGIGWNVLEDFSGEVHTLTSKVEKQQHAELDRVRTEQIEQNKTGLEAKAQNLAATFARLAATPLQTFDYDTAGEQAKTVASDTDVVVLFAAKDGKMLVNAKNDKHPIYQEVLNALPENKRTLDDVVKALRERKDIVLMAEKSITQFGTELGKVELFVSQDRVLARNKILTDTLAKLEAETSDSFKHFTNSLAERKDRESKSVMMKVGVMAIIAILLTIAVVIVIARQITQPIAVAVSAAERVASGDLTTELRSNSDDETGLLLSSIQTMTTNLNSLVSQVKHSSIQLVSTATAISSNVKQQQSTVNDFGSSTAQIAAASKEISATSKELLQTMNDVSGVASDTANLADGGRDNLRDMETTISQLGDATQSISSKLSVIREKADEINMVVTTITKVADQTNLLSLNAAIEAEKAGEYGLGFAVVAREIRRLADQTAVATLDIEQMVREMQGAVSAGVMEMDRFAQDVKRGVEEVARIGGQQAKIIERVQALTPRFKSVNEGMHAQAQGAEQISDAMVQLSDGARRTMSSLEEFGRAADNLHAAVSGLKDEVSRFKVAS